MFSDARAVKPWAQNIDSPINLHGEKKIFKYKSNLNLTIFNQRSLKIASVATNL
jgi:hypothetical protein